MRQYDFKVGDIYVKYSKKQNEIRLWTQCYDSIPFDATDLFKVIDKIRKPKTQKTPRNELWEVEWDDEVVDVIESEDKPDEEFIESGIDADSPRWGHRVKSIRRLK